MAKIGYRDSVVSFVDVLGFRNILSTKGPEEISRIMTKVRDVLKPSSDEYDKSDVKGRQFSKPFGYSLSDAVVRIRPYDTKYRDGAFFYEILDLMYAQAELLNEGIIIRGALTVGKAYSHKTNDMAFGPAVAEAYEWESGRAIYPRIVVTDSAMRAYHSDKRLKSESEETETMNLLKRGDDGIYFIDYLNKMLGEFDHIGSFYEMLEVHTKLIRSSIQNTVPGSSVNQKYNWMALYHNELISDLMQSAKKRGFADRFFDEFGFKPLPFFKGLKVELPY